MANFYGTGRSNYIRWDDDKLEALRQIFGFTISGKGRYFAILADEEQTHVCLDPEEDEFLDPIATLGLLPLDFETDIELFDVVHLAFDQDATEDSLFVWMEIGSEKSRYLHGYAMAIDLTGEIVNQINIQDIYETEGVTSRAEY